MEEGWFPHGSLIGAGGNAPSLILLGELVFQGRVKGKDRATLGLWVIVFRSLCYIIWKSSSSQNVFFSFGKTYGNVRNSVVFLSLSVNILRRFTLTFEASYIRRNSEDYQGCPEGQKDENSKAEVPVFPNSIVMFVPIGQIFLMSSSCNILEVNLPIGDTDRSWDPSLSCPELSFGWSWV